MRLSGLLALAIVAAAGATIPPDAGAAERCTRSPDAEQYPLLVRHGPLRVYGTVGQGSHCYPWGMCPDHPLALTRRDFPRAVGALTIALPVILRQRPRALSIGAIVRPNTFDHDLMRRLCVGGDANGPDRTLVAHVDGDVFWISRLAKGWVVWHRF